MDCSIILNERIKYMFMTTVKTNLSFLTFVHCPLYVFDIMRSCYYNISVNFVLQRFYNYYSLYTKYLYSILSHIYVLDISIPSGTGSLWVNLNWIWNTDARIPWGLRSIVQTTETLTWNEEAWTKVGKRNVVELSLELRKWPKMFFG